MGSGDDAGGRKNGRGGVSPLDAALKSFLRTSGIGEHLGPWAIFRAFADAAGPTFSRHARAVKFTRGELLVEVDSAAHLAELKGFLGDEIRSRANELLVASGSKSSGDLRRITFRLKR
jgi:hypothetical protein